MNIINFRETCIPLCFNMLYFVRTWTQHDMKQKGKHYWKCCKEHVLAYHTLCYLDGYLNSRSIMMLLCRSMILSVFGMPSI